MNIIIPKNTLIKKTISHMMNDYTNVTGIACVFVDINGKERSDKYNFSPFVSLCAVFLRFEKSVNNATGTEGWMR